MVGRYDGVVLWSPGDEVAAISSGQHRRAVVHLKDKSPRAVFGAADTGVVHFFLGTPSAVVAGAELPQVVPVVLTALGYMQSGGGNLSFALSLYSIFLVFTPNIIIRPMFAWISSLIGRSGSIRNAFSNSKGNYLQLLCLSIIFEVPMIIVEQVCVTFAINPVVMWLLLSPLIVLSNVMIAKLYDYFFLNLD